MNEEGFRDGNARGAPHLAALALAPLACASASPSPAAPPGGGGDTVLMYFDERADGTLASLRPGDSFAITLPENPSAGYRWSMVSDGAPVLRVDADSYHPLGASTGAPGQREWRMRVQAAGDAEVQFVYARSWEAQKPARRFTLRVESRG